MQTNYTADVVIVGGGPAGTAVAWALNRYSPKIEIALIEKAEQLGSGASKASLENFRTSWPCASIAHMMLRSVEVFLNADEYLGDNYQKKLSIKQQGYLYCAFNEKQAKNLLHQVKHLHQMSLTHIEYLDIDEMRYRYGWLGKNVIAGMVDPSAGWLDSNSLIYSYIKNIDNIKTFFNVNNLKIKTSNGCVSGVETPDFSISSPSVVIAAGAGSRQIARTAGIELPIVVRPSQSFTTSWRHSDFPKDAPLIIGSDPYPHVRPEGAGTIWGWEYNWNTKKMDSKGGKPVRDYLIDPVWPVEKLKDLRFPSLTLHLMARQFGFQNGEGFSNTKYLSGVRHQTGYYVYRSPSNSYYLGDEDTRISYRSQRAIIDRHPEIPGLFMSVAHVGHGIMSSPCAGEIAASKILGLDLPNPLFSDFEMNTHWVPNDGGGI